MMISFVLLRGTKVNNSHRKEVPCLMVVILPFGLLATTATSTLIRTTCFFFGLGISGVLVYTGNVAILEHSDHKEALFTSAAGVNYSPHKKLGRKIICTWILFPTWFFFFGRGGSPRRPHQ